MLVGNESFLLEAVNAFVLESCQTTCEEVESADGALPAVVESEVFSEAEASGVV
jgi:hypothetical protein